MRKLQPNAYLRIFLIRVEACFFKAVACTQAAVARNPLFPRTNHGARAPRFIVTGPWYLLELLWLCFWLSGSCGAGADSGLRHGSSNQRLGGGVVEWPWSVLELKMLSFRPFLFRLLGGWDFG